MHALLACSLHVDVCAYARVRGHVHMRMYLDSASCLSVSIHLRSQVCECTCAYVCSQCAHSGRACIVLQCSDQGACRARP